MPKLRGWKDTGIIDIWTLTLWSGWEVINEDETKEPDNSLSLSNLESSPGNSGHKGHGSSGEWSERKSVCLYSYIFLCLYVFFFFFYPNVVQHDELREIFNDISSSSEDEDEEGERHEDEDLNIMDTEDDMVRQLHEKMNETDGSRDENDRNSQIGRMAVHLLSDQLLCIIRTAAQAQFKATIQYRRQADRQTNKSRPRLAFEWWASCCI